MAVLSCCISFGSYVGGLFGMNLDNVQFLEPINGLFYGIFGSSFGFMILSYFCIIYFYQKSGVIPKKAIESHVNN